MIHWNCSYVIENKFILDKFSSSFKLKNVVFIIHIHYTFLWSRDVPQKIWARSVQPFIGYKQIDTLTPRQAKFIYKRKKNFVDLKKFADFQEFEFFNWIKNCLVLSCIGCTNREREILFQQIWAIRENVVVFLFISFLKKKPQLKL